MIDVNGLVLVTMVVLGGATLATVVTTALLVGRTGLEQFARNVRSRPRETLAPVGLLGIVLLVNKFVRDLVPEVSQLIGWNVTEVIYAAEGQFVAHLQSISTPELTLALSVAYLPGYVFLLVFPLIAYASLEDLRPLERLAIGTSINYLAGLLLYMLFVSYGPRNMLPDLVEPLLYQTFPRSQLLTSQVNTNTNVFPSLHTSLSVTIALFSWQTREAYPWWTRVAVPVAACVVVSTVYLGIHWGIDVLAGVALGAGSVGAANRLR